MAAFSSAVIKRLLVKNFSISWSVYKSIHLSQFSSKRRKTEEEKQALLNVDFTKKSKFKEIKVIEVWKNMTVNELAISMGHPVSNVISMMDFVPGSDLYKKSDAHIDNWSVIQEIVKKFGLRWKHGSGSGATTEEIEVKDIERRPVETYQDVRPRPPVVTIMGHVDHGKTTLLDSLRNSRIVDKEFGGITQHIGAFSTLVNSKDRITFLDTPGHAAFSAMRNRGAQCTDIVILVVAADDGVMEQTVESIRMAKEANVPVIVAINKIDKPQSDVERTQKMLLIQGIQVEEEGGEVQAVPISALKGTNLDLLMDAVLVQAEMSGLTSDFQGPVEAVVLESCTDPYRGKLCTLLVQVGVLSKGDILVAGTSWCKVRSMFSDSGEVVSSASPSYPVQVLGWKLLPSAGDICLQVTTEKRARQIIDLRNRLKSQMKEQEDIKSINEKVEAHNLEYKKELEAKRKLGRARYSRTLSRPKETISDNSSTPKLNIVVKGDVDGSVEAILDVLDTYSASQDCGLDVVHYGVGPVSISDVTMAASFGALLFTFNAPVLPDAEEAAASQKVQIKPHNVIYKLIDDIINEINKLLPKKPVEEIIGEANVLQEFLINEGKNKVAVAGSRCVKGALKKNSQVKLMRSGEVIFQGTVESLRHLKNEVDTIKKDMECGIRLSDPSFRFLQGDSIIFFKVNLADQKISWDPGF